ncbi:MAG: class A beta-lactamase-related serine hydrolase [Oscillospiraceae bacterium]|nr:class A beta-lactamase-related serine hydrolase [Oscillospiraceae bacterium]
MKKTSGTVRTLLCLLLGVSLLVSAAPLAWADEADMAKVEGGIEITPEYEDEVRAMRNGGLFDDEELERMVEDFITEHKLKKENFSIGFVYTATGDAWYYNPDTWYYPGSMYKIPLMMLLSEQVSNGILDQEDELYGMKVSQIEEYILTYSNNDWAHRIRTYLGGDEVWRADAKAYADIPDGSYSSDYMQYCYFSPRYLTEVLTTLYFGGEERFPNIIPCMKAANPGHYFGLDPKMADYEIAQKYGSYEDNSYRKWNGTAGVIYTPNPIILTVMTLNATSYEKVIGDAAVMMTEYALKVDQRVEEYQKKQAEKEAAQQQEEQQAEQPGQPGGTAQSAGTPSAAPTETTAPRTERKLDLRRLALFMGLGAIVLVGVVVALYAAAEKRKKRRRYEEYRRRFEEELRQEQARERRRRQNDDDFE